MTAEPGKATSATPKRRLRRHPRHRSSFSVLVTLFAGGAYQNLNGHCKDLSEAGIGVLLAAELACGEVVSLKFSLPGSQEPWDLRAVLRHRRGYHYGFEFLSLAREYRQVLLKHLLGLERAD